MRSDDLLTKEQVAAFHEEVKAYLREKDRGVALLQRTWVLWVNVGIALVGAAVAILTRLEPESRLPRLTLSAVAVLVGGATFTVAAWLSLDGRRLVRSVVIAGVAVAVAAGGVAAMKRTGPTAPRPLLAPAKTGSDGCYIRPTGRLDCTL